jgi:hypothetical protein
MVIVFSPKSSGIGPLASPDATVVPFIVTVAAATATVGVTVMVMVVSGTLAV